MMKRMLTLSIIILSLGIWVSASSAHYIDLPVKWSQPPLEENGAHIWLSMANALEDATPQVVSNDWLCDGSGPVVALRWWGTYKTTTPPSKAPSFFVWIHSNNEGPPSKPDELREMYYLTPQEAFVGEYNVSDGGSIADPALYRYDAYLPVPFDQEKGQIYWLTIAADVNTLEGASWYRWEAINLEIDTSVLTPNNFITYFRLMGSGFEKDMSFEVMTPIPPSLLLLGSGLLGLGALGWRRKKQG